MKLSVSPLVYKIMLFVFSYFIEQYPETLNEGFVSDIQASQYPPAGHHGDGYAQYATNQGKVLHKTTPI